jgi:PAS domain S-box-containing protein
MSHRSLTSGLLERYAVTFAWIVLLAGIGLTGIAWNTARSRELDRAHAVFTNWADNTSILISDRMADYAQVLRGASGLFASAGSVTRSEWHDYVTGLKLDHDLPGTLGLGFAGRVRLGDVDAFVRKIRSEGVPDYLIHPASRRDEYFPVMYREPSTTETRLTVGFDMLSEPVRRAAMDAARDSGEPTLSGRIELIQDKDRTPLGVSDEPPAGFLLLYPVYSRTMPHETTAERRQALVAFVYIPFRLDHLLAGIVNRRPPGIDFEIFDGDVPTADGLLYDDDHVLNGTLHDPPLLFSQSATLTVAGHPWTLYVSTMPEFEATVDQLAPRLVLLSGITVTGLLFVLVGAQGRMRLRAVKLAGEMTSELRASQQALERDIARREIAEEANQRLAAVVENSTDFVGMATLDGTLFYLNPGGRAYLGVEHNDQVIGKPVAELIHDDGAGSLEASLDGIRKTGSWTGDTVLRHVKTGRPIPCEATAFMVRQGDTGKPMCMACIARDITGRRHMETQLRQAQKMESIGTLAGGIAHDFNNILGAINGYTELAKLDVAGNERAMKDLEAVELATHRATDLVSRILTFSRPQEQSLQSIQLGAVVKEAVKLLRASLPASIDIRTTLDANAYPVLADATQIHQIVMNLGTNAWHAMEDAGGVLEVALGTFDVDADLAKRRLDLQAGRYTMLSVRDTGAGMDRATQERIFEPFFTTKPPGKGTGLGLATVHGIMKNHHGAISVYSQTGEGTTFHVYFPAADPAICETEHRVTPSPRGCGQHILFVDDEAPLAEWGKDVLERLGYQVTTQTDVFDAIAEVRDHPRRFDLVVTDLTMPGMSGMAFAQTLLDARADTRIILTTGYSGALTEESVHRAGIRELLLKPHTVQTLGDAVHRALA